jgi:hypothetical protein
MKYVLMFLIMLASNLSLADDCTTQIWTQVNLSKCIAHHWNWDQEQRLALLGRMYEGKVEIDIFEIVNARCDIHMTVYDPHLIEKQQYLDCTSNMLE